MNKRIIGGIELPPYMIGTWAWGTGINGSGMVFGNRYHENQLIETFAAARKLGFDLWDTAEVYGMGSAETLLGKCMKAYGKVKISTKFNPPKKYSCGQMRQSLEASMSRLEVNRPDIYWLHLPNNYSKNLAEAAELYQQGKIKAIGVSNFNLRQIRESAAYLLGEGIKLAAVQNHFSLLSMPREQLEIIEWCSQNDAAYFSYMVLEQGALSGHYNEKHHFPLLSNRNFRFGRSKFHKIAPLLDFIKKLAEKYGVDPSQIAIIWAASKGTVPIVGVTKPSHVEQLAVSAEIKLDTVDIIKLEELAASTKLMIKGSWESNNC